MISLFVLLPALLLCSQAPPPLDWTKCASEVKCHCMEGSLFREQEIKAPETIEESIRKFENNCKEIGMQSKYFTDDFALFQLQVKGVSYDLQNDPKLILDQHDMQFGCKRNSKDGTVEVHGNENYIKKYSITLFEDRSRFGKEDVLCAFTMKQLVSFTTKLTLDPVMKNIKTRMVLETNIYEYFLKGSFLFLSERPLCDPYSFNDLSEHPHFRVLPLQNRDQSTLNCASYTDSTISYTMRYTKKPEVDAAEMKELVCKKNDKTDDYSFRIVKKGDNSIGDEEVVEDPDMYTFFCAAPFEEVCSDPRRDCTSNSDPKCPKFLPGGAGVPATLKCDDHKYIIDGEYVQLDSDPVCKREDNDAAFFFKLSGNYEQKPGAQCFTKFSCKAKSALLLTCEDETGIKCGKAVQDEEILRCKDANRELRIYSIKDNSTLNASSSYACNPDSGLYENGTAKVAVRSRVSCIETDTSHLNPEAPIISDTIIYCIIGGVFLFCLAALAMIWFLVSCCRRRRREVGVAGKRGWMKLKKRTLRIAECQKIFDNILNTTTPDTANNILNGLNFIHMLLETETDDIECWEMAQQFLMRFHGAIVKIDHSVWHLFNRYMYLQAKKIIDKYGWLAPTPIRNKKRKGLMRVVAIKLLSFCVSNPTNRDALHMIKTGFRELQFKAVDQYPHCGVLWSVIMHARPAADLVNGVMVKFDAKKFLQYLKTIVHKAKLAIPKEETIPGFGSIAQQAAFALGGSTSISVHDKPVSEDIFFKKDDNEGGAISKSYFAGMIYTLCRNPTVIILRACQMWPNKNKEFMPNIVKHVPESEWLSLVDNAVKILTYYGKHLDAKRLLGRFTSRSEEEVVTLHEEQQEFEEAIESKKDDLRNWFGKRTDKEELKKKKPDAKYDNKAKLDHRISGQGVTDVKGGTKSNSNSGSNSEIEKGSPRPQSDEKGTTTPPAAAASPAANAAAAAATPQ